MHSRPCVSAMLEAAAALRAVKDAGRRLLKAVGIAVSGTTSYRVGLGPEQSCTAEGPWLLNVPLTSMDTYMGQTDGIQRDSRCTYRKNWVLGKKG